MGRAEKLEDCLCHSIGVMAVIALINIVVIA
jgi:hypothetical protein